MESSVKRDDLRGVKWLWEKRFRLLLIGLVASPLLVPNLWNHVRSDWRFWFPYAVAMFAAAVLIADQAIDGVRSLYQKR
jgi:hypothetical protein